MAHANSNLYAHALLTVYTEITLLEVMNNCLRAFLFVCTRVVTRDIRLEVGTSFKVLR